MTNPNIIGDTTPVPPYALIMTSPRAIGTIIPDITLEEHLGDASVITKHPVQAGCPISDHAYALPPTIQMKIAFSDATKQQQGYAVTMYNNLLALKNAYSPFSVTTGKRQYSNMLISNIIQITDQRSANIVQLVVNMEYVRITDSQNQAAVYGGSTASNSSQPDLTTPAANAGALQGSQLNNATPPAFAINTATYNFGSVPLTQ